jgi:DNA-binding response OmpR family regulator
MTKNLALVIEEDQDLSEIFAKALQTAGFEVEAIRAGKTAQQRLGEVVPQVIVLDLHLPFVDGSTLLTQIQSTQALSNTKVIITTADNVLAEMYRDRATIVMVKPISFSQLRDISQRLKT